ncbi:hypothetical protein [Terricaulis sp.]|uniref:hypothetical protein n=1 Tax=Terricaulis sp. TaxID=2768686 RepID=UPI00378352FF
MSRPVRAALKRDFEAVREVLRTVWNPVGAEGLPEDEYDDYVWPIVALLRRGADTDALMRHFAEVEAIYFGSTTSGDKRRSAVAALLALGSEAEGP